LKALDIKLEQHWRVNESFFDVLTKTELDAVCDEIGLAKAAGKTYTSLKNGSKKDFVAGMLKVEGFEYLGAIPKLMRW
jgi:ParB family chromosome partitioning protein